MIAVAAAMTAAADVAAVDDAADEAATTAATPATVARSAQQLFGRQRKVDRATTVLAVQFQQFGAAFLLFGKNWNQFRKYGRGAETSMEILLELCRLGLPSSTSRLPALCEWWWW